MKKSWQTKMLGDIADVQSGGTPLVSNKAFWNGNLPWYSSGELNDLYTSVPERHVSALGIERSNAKLFPKGSLLIGMYDTAALKMSILDRAGAFNQAIAGVRPDEGIDLVFVLHAINAIRERVLGQRRGVRQKNLSLRKIREIPIPVPSLAEQQRIVGLLDEAFEGLATAKANAEKNLQNARALFESHLQSVLRNKKWKWKTLGDLCNDVEYGSSAKSKAKAAGGVPVLRMGNIQNGRLDWENLVYTDDKAEIKRYLLKPNDVLFNRTNSPELVGKTAIYRGEMPAIFAGYLIRIHRKEELLDAEFLTYFLNSQIAFDYGKTVVISSVNQANINGTKLKSYPIPAPSLAEQKAIVSELTTLSAETQRLARLYERKLAALEALKKSLLHQAFSGKL